MDKESPHEVVNCRLPANDARTIVANIATIIKLYKFLLCFSFKKIAICSILQHIYNKAKSYKKQKTLLSIVEGTRLLCVCLIKNVVRFLRLLCFWVEECLLSVVFGCYFVQVNINFGSCQTVAG